MLAVSILRSSYGRIEVLHGIDLEVNSVETVVVIGADGAGKTTLLHCMTCIHTKHDGNIAFHSENFTQEPAYKRVQREMASSPERRQIFSNVTVEENLRLGAYLYTDERVEKDMQDPDHLSPELREKRNDLAG